MAGRPTDKVLTPFGAQLIELVNVRDHSLNWLAGQLGLTTGYLSNVAYGRKDPTESLIDRVAEVLVLTPGEKGLLIDSWEPQVRVTLHKEHGGRRIRIQGTIPAKHEQALRNFLASLTAGEHVN